ncbi:unnamed protein product [Echinostoma caproni]|uniref:Uncharacterized protein n=1 Tax=Echinostoma caproni TaxID=27848 RepID=A0A3P8GJQ8_9TREM|nr:unnamed protein product [Echinostoma caproni]
MIFLFTFDHAENAETYLNIVRFNMHFGSALDILLIPLFNVLRSAHTAPNLELTMFDVKYPCPFRDYIKQLPEVVSRHMGTMVGATSSLKVIYGSRVPNYVMINQWLNEENFQGYLHKTIELAKFITQVGTGADKNVIEEATKKIE